MERRAMLARSATVTTGVESLPAILSRQLDGKKMDNRKYIVMAFLGASVALGVAVHGLAVPLLTRLEVGDPSIGGMISATGLVGAVAALIAFVVLNRHPVSSVFTDEVITELRKVSWPDKEETIRSTSVVIGFSIGLALALGGYDFVWLRLTRVLLATGS